MKKATVFQTMFVIALIAAILFSGCNKDDSTGPAEVAPEIPPITTLEIDFSSFDTTNAKALGKRGGDDRILMNNNWRVAASKLGLWNLVLVLNLAVPVTAFKASFTQVPVLNDGTWTWSYNFGLGQSAELTARPSGGNIIWEMRITRPDVYTDYLWFSGESNLNATAGTWRLNFNPQDPAPYLDIVWNRNPSDGTFDIKYTNIRAGDPGNGGFIFAGFTNNSPFNAFYEIHNPAVNNDVNIEWNRTDFSGRISDRLAFGDTDWHCWDTAANNLQDMVCQ